jgi:Fe-S cluster biogenesis protein NfuA
MPIQPEFQQRLQSIERLLSEIEANANPSLLAGVQELVQMVMDLNGAGIERMLELIGVSPDQGEKTLQKLGRDELVSSLLVLYGLHPVDLETRVKHALDKVRLKVRAHEGELELIGIHDGSVRLRLQANGHGCGSSGQALQEMVENALYQAAPDIVALVIEGAGEKQGFVPVEMLLDAHVSKDFALSAVVKGAP